MNMLSTAFLLPWRTVHRSLRWLGGGVSLLLVIAALGVAMYAGGARGWLYGIAIYAFGAAYFWMCVMGCLLLVATDARRQCLPGVQHTVTLSILLYGMISALLPLPMLLPLGGDAVAIVLVAWLAASAGLAEVLLPRYTTLVLGVLPVLAISLRHHLPIPFPGQAGFVPLGLTVLAALVAICVLCWRRLLRNESPTDAGPGSAMVLQYRRHGAMAGGLRGASRRESDSTASGAHAAPAIRLGRVGPNTPVLALRMALGENLAPRTLRSQARRFARVGLPLLLFIPLMAIVQAGDAHGDVAHELWLGVNINVTGWLGIMGGIGLMAAGCLPLRARWRRMNADLSLLALLPGLGDAASQRRHLLIAALGRPLALQALLLTVVLAAAFALHAGPVLVIGVALAQLGAAATVAALLLREFGHASLPGWAMAAVLAGMALLIAASTYAPLLATLGRRHLPLMAGWPVALAVLWIAATIMLGWLGRSGWRSMQRQPHPFLEH